MTVVAWDGKTLAADRQANASGLRRSVTKIKKFNGELLFSSGKLDIVMSLYDWYERGAKPAEYPDHQKEKDDWCALNVIKVDGRLFRYEQTPIPFLAEDKFYAVGSGRDFAIAAMHMGADARQAVEIASLYDVECGMGIDTLTLDGGK